jgi:predicted GNAT family acetyltransferase
MSEPTVRDNPSSSRYELWNGNELISFADYVRRGDVLLITHVETRPDMRDRGNADQLMHGMLADLRSRGLRVQPLCSHAVGYIRDHPDEADLVA